MKKAFGYLFLLCMMYSGVSIAQKEKHPVISWRRYSFFSVSDAHPGATGYAGMLAGLHQHKLIIAGGANFPVTMPWLGGTKKYYDSIYVMDKLGHRLDLYKKGMRLPEPIAYTAACSTDMGVFYTGGENAAGISKKSWLLTWDDSTQQTRVAPFPDLPVALTNASAAASGCQVFIAGGETAEAVSDKFFTIDVSRPQDGWTALPALPKPLSHAVLVCRKEKNGVSLFLSGGRRKQVTGISDLSAATFYFYTSTGKWVTGTNLPYALSAGTGVMTPSGSVVLLGGDKGTVFTQVEKLIKEIKEENDPLRKEELVKRKATLQYNHPGFSGQLLVWNEQVSKWWPAGKMAFPTPVTTVALCWDDCIIVPSGEIRAGVRSPYILVGKLSAAYK